MTNKYINILNPNACSPKNLLMKAYEFKISGYPDNDKDLPGVYFNNISIADRKKCGLVRVKNTTEDEKSLRSCDIIESNDNTENSIYTECNAKHPAKKKQTNHKCNLSKEYILSFFKMMNNAITIMEKYIDISDYNDSQKYFIYNKKINKNTKVILIGDIHGGVHTFYRLITRFIEYKFINDKYEVNDGHVIILCGDILDRGGYSIEILKIIFKLLINSNKKDDIRFIYNRGNHEDYPTYKDYGLFDEFKNKIEPFENDIFDMYMETTSKTITTNEYTFDIFSNTLNEFYHYCPTAIILNYGSKKIFVCHGGIPLNKKKPCNDKDIVNLDISNEFNEISESDAHQIMWNDFSKEYITQKTIRDNYNDYFCAIGSGLLNKFMKQHQIDLIIRGHQDSFGNTVLFDETHKDDDSITINFKKDFISVSDEIKSDSNDINILLKNKQKPQKNKDNSINGPIAVFDLNKFNSQDKYKKIITISSNTGYGRKLTYDSFLLIENDN